MHVEISGWVQKPGIYALFTGEPLSKALRLAKPKPFADLSKCNWVAPAKVDCNYFIERKSTIQIEIHGCGKEKIALQMDAGSRVCDIKKRLELPKDADFTLFKSRRLLKDQEILYMDKKAQLPENVHFDER